MHLTSQAMWEAEIGMITAPEQSEQKINQSINKIMRPPSQWKKARSWSKPGWTINVTLSPK
jgi:hypothetical protein